MADRPNIILLMVDQMRGDSWGAAGNPAIQTPNLNHLAGQGTRFNHAYSACPSCIPARAILWTGMDQWHVGRLGMGTGQGSMPNDYPYTMAGMLSRGGYRTHLVGKGHFHPYRSSMGFQSIELDESGRHDESLRISDYRQWFYKQAPNGVTPDDHGVDWNAWQARPWHTEEYLHPTAWTARQAIHYLKNRDPNQPFFLNVSFARPHSPYVPPQAYWDMYINEDLPAPYMGDWAKMHDDPKTATRYDAWRGKMTPRQIHLARTGYYGEISFIDAQIGCFMQYVKQQGKALNNTWFIMLSDHGDMQGDHNLWRKTYAYEGSARIPFMIVPPASHRAGRSLAEEVVELRDVMPTVLAIAGIDAPPTNVGRNLLPLLETPATDWRKYIHGEHCTCYGPEQEMQYVTDGLRKFIWLPRLGMEQFFDLESDPGETRNLVDDKSRGKEVQVWRQRLIAELQRRQCGWCENGELTCVDGPLISPYNQRRWDGTPDMTN
jgi:arylsulfatase A-like enzyme